MGNIAPGGTYKIKPSSKSARGARRFRVVRGCTLLALCVASADTAAIGPAAWYVAPEISYIRPDPSSFEKSDVSLGLSIGRSFARSLLLEAGYYVLRLVPEDSPGIVEQQNLQLGAHVDLASFRRLAFHASLGVGASHNDLNGTESTLPFGFVGVGYSWLMTATGRLALDHDVRARYTRDDDRTLGQEELVDAQMLLRLRYRFGTLPGAASTPTAPGPDATGFEEEGASGCIGACAPDRDRDGVIDASDRCPHTIPGVQVDLDGCMVVR